MTYASMAREPARQVAEKQEKRSEEVEPLVEQGETAQVHFTVNVIGGDGHDKSRYAGRIRRGA